MVGRRKIAKREVPDNASVFGKIVGWETPSKEIKIVRCAKIEADMPSDFECIAEFERVSTFSATNNSLRKVERIFRPKAQL